MTMTKLPKVFTKYSPDVELYQCCIKEAEWVKPTERLRVQIPALLAPQPTLFQGRCTMADPKLGPHLKQAGILLYCLSEYVYSM